MAEDTTDIAFEANEMSESLERLSARTRSLESSAGGFSRAMSQAFSRAVIDGRRLEDVLKSLTLRLSDLAVRMAFKPLERGLASGIEGLFSGFSGGGALTKSDSNMLASLGDIKTFADGGVIATPSYFPLGRGMGLAGEAGPEAILPLRRGADGSLGVAAAGMAAAPNVTIHIATPDAASFRRSETYVTGLIARAVARGQRSL